MSWDIYESPFGPLTLVESETGLRAVHFPGRAPVLDPADRDRDLLGEVRDQLEEYFGERETFDVALDVSGTAFQRRVWRALQELPYGRARCTAILLARSACVTRGRL